jgi:4,5:9,10-diseco-3-hydroxy-5,9,17-trioxoandrosta-1(10),2-diene-4-oate hydrolase
LEEDGMSSGYRIEELSGLAGSPAAGQVPNGGRRVPAGDIQLHVTEAGSGPALVWLHGAGPGASGMSNFRQNLGAFAGYRNLVFDLPRFGGSDKPVLSEPFAPYAAARLAAALDGLRIGRASLVGNSMGGAVAMKLAADRPDLVDRLVLMAPAGTTPDDWAGGVPEGLLAIVQWMHQGPSRELVERFARLQVYDPSVLTEDLIRERLAAASDPAIVETNPQTNPVPGDLKPDLPRIEAPALLLWGREDRFIPLEWALEALRGIPDAELRVIPRCGHWVQFERRELFDRAAGEFLGGVR